MLKVVFLLVRLPFFLIFLNLYSTLGLVAFSVWVFWFCLLLLFNLPYSLLDAAFTNDTRPIVEWFVDPLKEWFAAPKAYFIRYRRIFDWLIRGGREPW